MDPIIVLRAIIALPIIFFIPGYVTFTAFKVNKTENLKLSFFETIFLQVLTSIVITGWIAFTLAQVGHFSLWILCELLLGYSLVMAIIFRDRFRAFTFPRPSWNLQSAFLILLTILAVCLFFHPSEEIPGRHDIGIYISTGANIAETGSLVIHDPILSAMPDSARDTFYLISADPSPWHEGWQFPDFSIVDKDSGTIFPLQPPLRQVWFAIFYSIFALFGGFYSQPLFGLLGVLSVFLVGKTVWNWRVGAIASSLLAVNFVQVFFSQYTSPEILFQFLAFGGITTVIVFMRTHNKFFGIISAMCFGQLLMIKIDALLVLIPLVVIVFYILLTSKQGKVYLYFIIPFLALWFHSLAHIYYFCMPYLRQLCVNVRAPYGIAFTPTLVMVSLLGISLIMTVALVFTALYSMKGVKLSRIGQKLPIAVYMRCFLMFLTVLLIVYLWLTSSAREPSILVANLVLIPRGDTDTTVALSWFVGWLGLRLALFGLLSMLYRKPYAERYLFLGTISLTLLAHLYTLSNNPVFPWAMRRTVPILFPAIMILIGYGVDRIRDLFVGTAPLSSARAVLGRLTLILLVLALVVPSSSMCHTLIKPQFEGFVHQVDEVADFFPADSIILDHSRFTDVTLSLPLKYIYGKNSIYLHKDPTNANEFAEMVKLWEQEGREVYLIVWSQARFDSISSKLSGAIKFKHEATFFIEVSKVEWEWHTFSNKRVESENPLKVYRMRLP